MDKIKRGAIVAFFLTLIFLASLTHSIVFMGGNDASRFAQIESLVDYGHTYIDESMYSWTVDKVTIGGRNYSNKPPVLSIIGAGVYFLLKKTLGITFARNESTVIYLLTFFLVVIPTAWLAALFYSSLERYKNLSLSVKCLTTLALAAGTILTSFTVTLNNHTVSAVLLFAAFHFAWRGGSIKAGICSALAACIDIPALIFILFLAYMLYYVAGRKTIMPFFIPLIAGVAIFVAVNLWITGYPLPSKLIPGGIEYSRFGPSFASLPLPDSWSYPLKCLFGWHGFFSVSPVLIFGAIGMGVALKREHPLPRKLCLLLILTLIATIISYIFIVGSYGGWSYGFRYLIPIIPIIMFFAPIIIEKFAGIFTGVLAVSTLFALIGVYNPWPPGYEQEINKDPIASVTTNPVGANASAWMEKYFPDSALTESMTALFISSSEILRIQYLMLFYSSKGDEGMAYKMMDVLNKKFLGPNGVIR